MIKSSFKSYSISVSCLHFAYSQIDLFRYPQQVLSQEVVEKNCPESQRNRGLIGANDNFLSQYPARLKGLKPLWSQSKGPVMLGLGERSNGVHMGNRDGQRAWCSRTMQLAEDHNHTYANRWQPFHSLTYVDSPLSHKQSCQA